LRAGPQSFDFEAVVWGPKPGDIRELRPLAGDTVGVAIGINDSGQAVGASGTCANTTPPPFAGGPHAVPWDADGTPHDMGSLGGNGGGIGLAINHKGDVVGAASRTVNSSLSDGTDAFLWTSAHGMQDLGTLPGDTASGAVMINEPGDVAGLSLDASGNARAVIWHNGAIRDLNDLAPNSPLFLLFATAINSRGEISGFGATAKGDLHGFLAVPDHSAASRGAENSEVRESLTEDVRKLIRDHLPLGAFGLRPRESR
jgi:probable HAF family extracellular repeat protein